MFYTLDRFEGEFAILIDDNKNIISILAKELENAAEGNVYKSDDGKVFVPDFEETESRKKRAVCLHKSLFNKAKK